MKLKVPPPVLVILSVILMKVLDNYLTFGQFHFEGQKLLAGIFLMSGTLLAVLALNAFRTARTTTDPMHPEKASQLVVNGPYGFSRNPMYLAILLVLIGGVVYLGNWLNILVLGLFYAYITRFQIIPEEEVLRAKFGTSFEEYCSKVRRWL